MDREHDDVIETTWPCELYQTNDIENLIRVCFVKAFRLNSVCMIKKTLTI